MDDLGTKRRLPLWMLGVAASDQVSKSEEENKHVNNKVKEGIASQSLRSKSKSTAGIKRIKKDIPLGVSDQEPSEVNTCLLTKCESKKRRKKLCHEEDVGSDSEFCETVFEKKRCTRGGRKTRECARQKQQEAKSLRSESSEEIENSSPGEGDGELTMEDLMSIAQEYVRTDEHSEKQWSSHGEHEVERPHPSIALSGDESGGLPNALQSNRRSPTHKEIVSVHNSTGTLALEESVVDPIRTGDPAQDMLDLFLGPLLKKPRVEKNKIELIKEDMMFSCEFEKQRQNNIGAEELVPLTKKKSSLKDKVAMFLD